MRRSRSRGRIAVLIASTAATAVTIVGSPAVAAAAPPPPAAPVAAAPVNTPATARPATVADPAAGSPARREVPALRTETSSTVAVPGGGYRTTVSGGPVNYQDAAGAWQPIDTTLVRDGAGWRPAAAGWTAELPATLGTAPITVRSGSRWVSLTPTGAAAVTGTVKGSRITYAEVFPGISLVYDALPSGLKESILLDRPGARASFGFALRASAGLTATEKGGAIRVADGAGGTVFELPAGFVTDPVDDASGRTAVTTRLSSATALTASAGAGLTLNVAAPWLSAPGRQWPVVLDPTVVIGPDRITDCHMVNGVYANISHCNSDLLEFGWGNSANGNVSRRLMMKFDLSAIPKSAVIKVADIALTRVPYTQTPATFPAQAMRIAQEWTGSATWNTTGIAGGAWSTPGGGGFWGPTKIDTASVDNQAATTRFSIPSLTQQWVQGVHANHGIQLMSADESVVGFGRYASTTNATADNRPKFTVDWTVQHGQRDTNTFVTKQLSDRCEVGGNVGNGNLMLRCAELSVGGVGQSVDISRYYNSGDGPTFLSRADSPLGINRWRLSTGIHLAVRPNSVEYTDGSGAIYPFHQLGGTAFRRAPGLGATLEKDQPAAGQYRLKFTKSGAQYVFRRANTDFLNIKHQLWKIIDRNGNTTEFTYTAKAGYAEGALASIKDTRGRVVTIGYTFDAGSGKDFLTSITDSTGRQATYAYSGWNLTTATDMDGDTTTYGYANFGTSNSQLATFTDARTHPTEFVYDTNGRVLDMNLHPSAGVTANTHFTYNDTVSPPTTTVRDANNRSTVYDVEHKDYASRVTRTLDAKGKARSRTFTSNAQVATESNEFGSTTNTWGENPTDTGPDGGESLTKSVGPSGATTLNQYRTAGGTSCPAGVTPTGSGYDAICSRDDAGNRSSFTYDGPGNRSQSTNQLAATAKVDRAVNGSGVTPTDGRVLKATDPRGHVTTYGYTDVTVNGVTTKRLSTITAPGGSALGVRNVTYDALDRLRTQTSGRSTVATRSYDGADRLTGVTYNDSTPAMSYTYDANGNTTQRVDGSGTTTFTYDRMNRPTSKTLPGGTVLSYTYDLVGNLTTSVQAGGTTSYDYDSVNQVVKMTERSGRITRFAYRADGKRTDTWYNANLTDPPSTFAAHIRSEFTAGGQVSRIKTTRASSDADANRVKDYSFCYRPRSVTGATCTSAKDETNDRSKIQWVVNNIGGGAITLTYDGAGRLTQKADLASGGTTSTSTYDLAGNRTSEKETNRTDRHFGFTSGNAMCWTASVPGTSTGCTPPAGAQTTWTYDAAGNQTVNPDATATYNGTEQTTGITGGGVTTPFGYAADNQTERTSKGGTTYVNGLLGLQSETTGGQTTYYERDPTGQLVSQRTPAGDFYYVFDQNGSVLALIDPSGVQRASYSYSPWGEDRGTSALNGTLPPNPYRFHGQYLDSATGLYKMGLRYYSPKYARWTQQDVIETIGDPSTGNRYAFAGDDPVNNIDPSGAVTLSLGISGCAIACLEGAVNFDEDGVSLSGGYGVGPRGGVDVSVTAGAGSNGSGGYATGTCSGPGVTGSVTETSDGSIDGAGGLTSGTNWGCSATRGGQTGEIGYGSLW